MKELRTAVIGMGNMGTAHAAAIAGGEIDGMRLTAVCDIIEDRVLSFAEKYPEIKAYTDFEELLKDSVADCVIIAVPHPIHSQMAIKALKRDLNVIVEKPADISVSKVKELNKEAQKSKGLFGIMLNQRTNQLFSKAYEIVKSGALGELKRTVWIITNWYRTQSYYDSGEWRATWSGEGGGVLVNQAPHNLDIWQWICGMPKSVTAFCDVGKYHNIEVEDDVTIFARYENGATGTFITSTGEYPGTNRLEISGTLGKIVLENGILKWWKLKQNEREACFGSNESFVSIDYDYTEIKQTEKESGHRVILKNFAKAVLYGESLIANGIEGINEVILSNAAYLSSWNGNSEIILPFSCDEFDSKLSELISCSERSKLQNNFTASYNYNERWQVKW